MCFCGHIIRDQTDDLPHKAEYYADADYSAHYDGLIADLSRIVTVRGEAERKNGEGAITEIPGLPEIFGTLETPDVISDTIAGYESKFGHHMCECEQCGRLWLQYDRRNNRYVSFLPETEVRSVLGPLKGDTIE